MYRQRILPLLLLCLFIASCAAPPAERKEHKAAAQREEVTAVAVWDIDNLSPSAAIQTDVGEFISGKVIETVEKNQKYTIVERQRIELALQELNIGSTSLADESTRLKLGRLVGARVMIFGAYQVVANQVRIDLRLVDVETGRVLKAAERTVPAADLATWLAAAQAAAEELL